MKQHVVISGYYIGAAERIKSSHCASWIIYRIVNSNYKRRNRELKIISLLQYFVIVQLLVEPIILPNEPYLNRNNYLTDFITSNQSVAK